MSDIRQYIKKKHDENYAEDVDTKLKLRQEMEEERFIRTALQDYEYQRDKKAGGD